MFREYTLVIDKDICLPNKNNAAFEEISAGNQKWLLGTDGHCAPTQLDMNALDIYRVLTREILESTCYGRKRE